MKRYGPVTCPGCFGIFWANVDDAGVERVLRIGAKTCNKQYPALCRLFRRMPGVPPKTSNNPQRIFAMLKKE